MRKLYAYYAAIEAKNKDGGKTIGVAAIYPEVAKLRKEGEPSVSIRKV